MRKESLLSSLLFLAFTISFPTTTLAIPTPLECSTNAGLCNGLDPVAVGCDQDAQTVLSTYFDNSMTLELRRSEACKTEWARVTTSNLTQYGIHACVYYANPPFLDTCDGMESYQVWSSMLDANTPESPPITVVCGGIGLSSEGQSTCIDNK